MDMTQLNRMINLRVLLQVLVLILVTPTFAVAGSLPTPRISGPTQAPDDKPLRLHFSYTPIHWSLQDKYYLSYWEQYWFCKPGKDDTPTSISIREVPWPGDERYCWLTQNRYSGLGPSLTSEIILVPRDGGVPADGTWYVRVRLAWQNSKDDSIHRLGSWSLWHRVWVFTSFAPKIVVKPPIVQAPKQNRIFVNQGVDIEVSSTLKHTDYSRWEYVLEWKRADYHTAANNTYAKQIYLKKYPNSSSSYFPPVGGLNSELLPWLSPTRLQAMPENSGTTGGFQVVGSKRPTMSAMSAHLNFSTLRSKRLDSSYLYQFRVREHIRNSKAYGPWSPWRGFIVQERIGSPTLYHYYHGAGALLHEGRALPRGTRGTIHGTTHDTPTVGLRHGIRQRGIRKKLAPAAPVRRLAPAAPVRRLAPATPVQRLTPAAPVRRLNLPAQLKLNR